VALGTCSGSIPVIRSRIVVQILNRQFLVPPHFFSNFPGVAAMLHKCATVTATIHDARSFYLDLTKELQRLHSPRYPQREFWRALELADHADVVRAVTAINASEYADYFDRQQSREFTDLDDVDSRYLIADTRPGRPLRAVCTHTVVKSRPCQSGRSNLSPVTEPSIPILFFADEILGIHPYDWQCRILLNYEADTRPRRRPLISPGRLPPCSRSAHCGRLPTSPPPASCT